MTIGRMFRAAALASALLGTWATAQGCGPSAGSYCNKVCDCTGCSASRLDECVDIVDDARKAAEADGCGSEFGDYLSCLDGELTCTNGIADADGCETETEALAKCASSVSFGPPTPDSYCDKTCACIGCATDEFAICVQQIEDVQSQAKGFGCGDSVDALLACVYEKQTCVGGQVMTSECDAETNAYVDCASGNGGSGGGSSGSGGG